MTCIMSCFGPKMSYCKKQLIQSESEYRLVGEDLRNKNLVVVLVVDRSPDWKVCKMRGGDLRD